MATAIDFKALMQEERKKARAAALAATSSPQTERKDSAAASSSATASSVQEQRYRLPPRDNRPAPHAVGTTIEDVHHASGWISAEEEAEIVRCIDQAPPIAWTPLRGRRLQSLGGLPQPPPQMMTREPLPGWVQSICDELVRSGAFPADTPPNHVLLNEYQPGQGIDAHKDGPLYLPHVAILSLNSHAAFLFVEDTVQRAPLTRLLLPPRGLLVFKGDAYEEHLHTVPAVEADDLTRPELIRLDSTDDAAHNCSDNNTLLPRRRRLSLTVRHVLHSRTPEEAAQERPSLAEPLPLWKEKQRLARWLDETPSGYGSSRPSAPAAEEGGSEMDVELS